MPVGVLSGVRRSLLALGRVLTLVPWNFPMLGQKGRSLCNFVNFGRFLRLLVTAVCQVQTNKFGENAVRSQKRANLCQPCHFCLSRSGIVCETNMSATAWTSCPNCSFDKLRPNAKFCPKCGEYPGLTYRFKVWRQRSSKYNFCRSCTSCT